ncbi:hypothetical protein P3342_001767 [Pyrenophora teres f. teres]|uniref:DUF8021 domain-containing protein n=1 Tax=Pyrenophora teres f. teres TaxID=97479 RepID=A0A6S6W3X5_9PLEO|nr:hypothetical protein PTNB85_03123 [Pyrenophora teres f. teres]KAE8865994.1 hypothetical protein PTNB29_03141 [Pyrenophora teres f. teres]KAK1919475.1 hypothetical protein P3342_001767 [Pyrenophora teres f. teres]CAE7176926.1 hypothetical protein PTTW11_06078 [Pyrenophora teres f. teres]
MCVQATTQEDAIAFVSIINLNIKYLQLVHQAIRNFITTLTTVFAAQASAACTLETLQAITEELLAAQTAGQSSFSSLSNKVAYTENRKSIDIKSGILTKPMKIDHARSQHDTTQCAAFSEFIIANSAAPYVITTQLRIDNTSKVSQMDTIWTSKGDWLFNATGTLYWASREKWDSIPVGKRDSRAVIKAAGDAYCDLFNNKTVQVPWGSPCARLEGGIYTGKGEATDSCNVGVPSGVPLVNRQYVIDDEYGTVDIMMDFGGNVGQEGAAGLPDSHEFRVEGGKLRYVHTLSSCGGKACM